MPSGIKIGNDRAAQQRLDQMLAEILSMKGVMPGSKAAPHAGTADAVPSTPYYTGPGGLFGVMGVERDVISTIVQARGIAGMLPAKGTNVTNPIYPFITSFVPGDTSKPLHVCDDPPTAGSFANCFTTSQFGRISYQTRTVNITRLGQQINRGEFQDLILVNEPLFGPQGDSAMLTPVQQARMTLANELRMRMTELGIDFYNTMAHLLWDGNPANNSASADPGYAEFVGLNKLIAHGHVDAYSNTTCPSLDSVLQDFNYASMANDSVNYVQKFTDVYRYLKSYAIKTNMMPVQWVIAMREEAFYELAAAWACTYATFRCNNAQLGLTQAEIMVDAGDVREMRDDMRMGQYLLIDGARIPVVFDDAITEYDSTTNSNVGESCFASDAYFLPITVRGSYASLYWEYFDFSAPNAAINALQGNGGPVAAWYWTDGGRFLWHDKTPINWCIQREALIEPRLILRTPHLAARLQNMLYCANLHPLEPFADDPYPVTGGDSASRPAPSFYSDVDQAHPFPII